MESLSKSELRKLKDGIASELTSMRDSLSSTYGYALQDTDLRVSSPMSSRSLTTQTGTTSMSLPRCAGSSTCSTATSGTAGV